MRDITTALTAGADAVKVFPSEQFGPAYIKTLKETHAGGDLFPIGGVTPMTIAEYLRAGATAAFAGSSLIDDDALRERRWSQITERAQMFIRATDSI